MKMNFNSKIRILSVLFLFCCFSSYAYKNTYVVIVAVADYKTIKDLSFTVNDANAFAKFLMTPEGGNVPSKNIYVLTNEKAKKNNIVHYAKKMFKRAGPNDRVIFYFSGHGDRGYFLPYDFNASEVRNGIMESALNFSDVKSIFKASKSKTKLLIADACFAGSLKNSKKSITKQPQEFKKLIEKSLKSSKQQIAVMLSCSKDETSLELGALKQGLFSYYLIDGLKGNADVNKNGRITIKELFYYIYDNTTYVAKKLGKSQTPVLFGNFSSNLIIGQ